MCQLLLFFRFSESPVAVCTQLFALSTRQTLGSLFGEASIIAGISFLGYETRLSLYKPSWHHSHVSSAQQPIPSISIGRPTAGMYFYGMLPAIHIAQPTDRVHDAVAERMRTYIDELVADGKGVTAMSVALRFQVSYAYVKAVFKSCTGQPIGGYIRTRKLEQACRMLQAGEPPLQVARYICWSYSHFNKAFKARYGVSPRGYKG